jgi:outer membrane protein OmpA-like peptidoglycan-associated protein
MKVKIVMGNVQKYAALDLESAKKEFEFAQSAATRHEDPAVAQIQLAAPTREVDTAKSRPMRPGQRDLATEQAARLQAEVDQLKATPIPRGLVLTPGDELFDTGKAELNSGSSRKLDQLAQFLTEHADRRVQIDGFTDSMGTDSYNQDLSQRRAMPSWLR